MKMTAKLSRHRLWQGVRVLGLAIAVAVAAWAAGLVWFAESIPAGPARPEAKTDAIVVLTGGPSRLKAGLELLAEGKARKLFVSGVYRGVEVAELLRIARQSPAEVDCCVVLGYAADSTLGNALETRAWMEREGFTSLRLVTANYHMRRSLLEFRRVMPETTIEPEPVAPPQFMRELWWQYPGTAALIAMEFDKYLLALVRPLWLPSPAPPEHPEAGPKEGT
jgi:uncharacterized SAM-binding protein YcdF (DUF218 family)